MNQEQHPQNTEPCAPSPHVTQQVSTEAAYAQERGPPKSVHLTSSQQDKTLEHSYRPDSMNKSSSETPSSVSTTMNNMNSGLHGSSRASGFIVVDSTQRRPATSESHQQVGLSLNGQFCKVESVNTSVNQQHKNSSVSLNSRSQEVQSSSARSIRHSQDSSMHATTHQDSSTNYQQCYRINITVPKTLLTASVKDNTTQTALTTQDQTVQTSPVKTQSSVSVNTTEDTITGRALQYQTSTMPTTHRCEYSKDSPTANTLASHAGNSLRPSTKTIRTSVEKSHQDTGCQKEKSKATVTTKVRVGSRRHQSDHTKAKDQSIQFSQTGHSKSRSGQVSGDSIDSPQQELTTPSLQETQNNPECVLMESRPYAPREPMDGPSQSEMSTHEHCTCVAPASDTTAYPGGPERAVDSNTGGFSSHSSTSKSGDGVFNITSALTSPPLKGIMKIWDCQNNSNLAETAKSVRTSIENLNDPNHWLSKSDEDTNSIKEVPSLRDSIAEAVAPFIKPVRRNTHFVLKCTLGVLPEVKYMYEPDHFNKRQNHWGLGAGATANNHLNGVMTCNCYTCLNEHQELDAAVRNLKAITVNIGNVGMTRTSKMHGPTYRCPGCNDTSPCCGPTGTLFNRDVTKPEQMWPGIANMTMQPQSSKLNKMYREARTYTVKVKQSVAPDTTAVFTSIATAVILPNGSKALIGSLHGIANSSSHCIKNLEHDAYSIDIDDDLPAFNLKTVNFSDRHEWQRSTFIHGCGGSCWVSLKLQITKHGFLLPRSRMPGEDHYWHGTSGCPIVADGKVIGVFQGFKRINYRQEERLLCCFTPINIQNGQLTTSVCPFGQPEVYCGDTSTENQSNPQEAGNLEVTSEQTHDTSAEDPEECEYVVECIQPYTCNLNTVDETSDSYERAIPADQLTELEAKDTLTALHDLLVKHRSVTTKNHSKVLLHFYLSIPHIITVCHTRILKAVLHHDLKLLSDIITTGVNITKTLTELCQVAKNLTCCDHAHHSNITAVKRQLSTLGNTDFIHECETSFADNSTPKVVPPRKSTKPLYTVSKSEDILHVTPGDTRIDTPIFRPNMRSSNRELVGNVPFDCCDYITSKLSATALQEFPHLSTELADAGDIHGDSLSHCMTPHLRTTRPRSIFATGHKSSFFIHGCKVTGYLYEHVGPVQLTNAGIHQFEAPMLHRKESLIGPGFRTSLKNSALTRQEIQELQDLFGFFATKNRTAGESYLTEQNLRSILQTLGIIPLQGMSTTSQPVIPDQVKDMLKNIPMNRDTFMSNMCTIHARSTGTVHSFNKSWDLKQLTNAFHAALDELASGTTTNKLPTSEFHRVLKHLGYQPCQDQDHRIHCYLKKQCGMYCTVESIHQYSKKLLGMINQELDYHEVLLDMPRGAYGATSCFSGLSARGHAAHVLHPKDGPRSDQGRYFTPVEQPLTNYIVIQSADAYMHSGREYEITPNVFRITGDTRDIVKTALELQVKVKNQVTIRVPGQQVQPVIEQLNRCMSMVPSNILPVLCTHGPANNCTERVLNHVHSLLKDEVQFDEVFPCVLSTGGVTQGLFMAPLITVHYDAVTKHLSHTPSPLQFTTDHGHNGYISAGHTVCIDSITRNDEVVMKNITKLLTPTTTVITEVDRHMDYTITEDTDTSTPGRVFLLKDKTTTGFSREVQSGKHQMHKSLASVETPQLWAITNHASSNMGATTCTLPAHHADKGTTAIIEHSAGLGAGKTTSVQTTMAPNNEYLSVTYCMHAWSVHELQWDEDLWLSRQYNEKRFYGGDEDVEDEINTKLKYFEHLKTPLRATSNSAEDYLAELKIQLEKQLWALIKDYEGKTEMCAVVKAEAVTAESPTPSMSSDEFNTGVKALRMAITIMTDNITAATKNDHVTVLKNKVNEIYDTVWQTCITALTASKPATAKALACKVCIDAFNNCQEEFAKKRYTKPMQELADTESQQLRTDLIARFIRVSALCKVSDRTGLYRLVTPLVRALHEVFWDIFCTGLHFTMTTPLGEQTQKSDDSSGTIVEVHRPKLVLDGQVICEAIHVTSTVPSNWDSASSLQSISSLASYDLSNQVLLPGARVEFRSTSSKKWIGGLEAECQPHITALSETDTFTVCGARRNNNKDRINFKLLPSPTDHSTKRVHNIYCSTREANKSSEPSGIAYKPLFNTRPETISQMNNQLIADVKHGNLEYTVLPERPATVFRYTEATKDIHKVGDLYISILRTPETVKLIHNCTPSTELAATLQHISYEQSQHQHVLTSLRGYTDTDKNIHYIYSPVYSTEEDNDDERSFGATGIRYFESSHECNQTCRNLRLQAVHATKDFCELSVHHTLRQQEFQDTVQVVACSSSSSGLSERDEEYAEPPQEPQASPEDKVSDWASSQSWELITPPDSMNQQEPVLEIVEEAPATVDKSEQSELIPEEDIPQDTVLTSTVEEQEPAAQQEQSEITSVVAEEEPTLMTYYASACAEDQALNFVILHNRLYYYYQDCLQKKITVTRSELTLDSKIDGPEKLKDLIFETCAQNVKESTIRSHLLVDNLSQCDTIPLTATSVQVALGKLMLHDEELNECKDMLARAFINTTLEPEALAEAYICHVVTTLEPPKCPWLPDISETVITILLCTARELSKHKLTHRGQLSFLYGNQCQLLARTPQLFSNQKFKCTLSGQELITEAPTVDILLHTVGGFRVYNVKDDIRRQNITDNMTIQLPDYALATPHAEHGYRTGVHTKGIFLEFMGNTYTMLPAEGDTTLSQANKRLISRLIKSDAWTINTNELLAGHSYTITPLVPSEASKIAECAAKAKTVQHANKHFIDLLSKFSVRSDVKHSVKMASRIVLRFPPDVTTLIKHYNPDSITQVQDSQQLEAVITKDIDKFTAILDNNVRTTLCTLYDATDTSHRICIMADHPTMQIKRPVVLQNAVDYARLNYHLIREKQPALLEQSNLDELIYNMNILQVNCGTTESPQGSFLCTMNEDTAKMVPGGHRIGTHCGVTSTYTPPVLCKAKVSPTSDAAICKDWGSKKTPESCVDTVNILLNKLSKDGYRESSNFHCAAIYALARTTSHVELCESTGECYQSLTSSTTFELTAMEKYYIPPMLTFARINKCITLSSHMLMVSTISRIHDVLPTKSTTAEPLTATIIVNKQLASGSSINGYKQQDISGILHLAPDTQNTHELAEGFTVFLAQAKVKADRLCVKLNDLDQQLASTLSILCSNNDVEVNITSRPHKQAVSFSGCITDTACLPSRPRHFTVVKAPPLATFKLDEMPIYSKEGDKLKVNKQAVDTYIKAFCPRYLQEEQAGVYIKNTVSERANYTLDSCENYMQHMDRIMTMANNFHHRVFTLTLNGFNHASDIEQLKADIKRRKKVANVIYIQTEYKHIPQRVTLPLTHRQVTTEELLKELQQCSCDVSDEGRTRCIISGAFMFGKQQLPALRKDYDYVNPGQLHHKETTDSDFYNKLPDLSSEDAIVKAIPVSGHFNCKSSLPREQLVHYAQFFPGHLYHFILNEVEVDEEPEPEVPAARTTLAELAQLDHTITQEHALELMRALDVNSPEDLMHLAPENTAECKLAGYIKHAATNASYVQYYSKEQVPEPDYKCKVVDIDPLCYKGYLFAPTKEDDKAISSVLSSHDSVALTLSYRLSNIKTTGISGLKGGAKVVYYSNHNSVSCIATAARVYNIRTVLLPHSTNKELINALHKEAPNLIIELYHLRSEVKQRVLSVHHGQPRTTPLSNSASAYNSFLEAKEYATCKELINTLDGADINYPCNPIKARLVLQHELAALEEGSLTISKREHYTLVGRKVFYNGANSFLSNFYKLSQVINCQFRNNIIIADSVEKAYQMAKCILAGLPDDLDQLHKSTAKDCKERGKNYTVTPEDQKILDEFMIDCMYYKFRGEFQGKLQQLRDCMFMEGTKDPLWGSGTATADIKHTNQVQGIQCQNKHGNLLELVLRRLEHAALPVCQVIKEFSNTLRNKCVKRVFNLGARKHECNLGTQSTSNDKNYVFRHPNTRGRPKTIIGNFDSDIVASQIKNFDTVFSTNALHFSEGPALTAFLQHPNAVGLVFDKDAITGYGQDCKNTFTAEDFRHCKNYCGTLSQHVEYQHELLKHIHVFMPTERTATHVPGLTFTDTCDYRLARNTGLLLGRSNLGYYTDTAAALKANKISADSGITQVGQETIKILYDLDMPINDIITDAVERRLASLTVLPTTFTLCMEKIMSIATRFPVTVALNSVKDDQLSRVLQVEGKDTYYTTDYNIQTWLDRHNIKELEQEHPKVTFNYRSENCQYYMAKHSAQLEVEEDDPEETPGCTIHTEPLRPSDIVKTCKTFAASTFKDFLKQFSPSAEATCVLHPAVIKKCHASYRQHNAANFFPHLLLSILTLTLLYIRPHEEADGKSKKKLQWWLDTHPCMHRFFRLRAGHGTCQLTTDCIKTKQWQWKVPLGFWTSHFFPAFHLLVVFVLLWWRNHVGSLLMFSLITPFYCFTISHATLILLTLMCYSNHFFLAFSFSCICAFFDMGRKQLLKQQEKVLARFGDYKFFRFNVLGKGIKIKLTSLVLDGIFIATYSALVIAIVRCLSLHTSTIVFMPYNTYFQDALVALDIIPTPEEYAAVANTQDLCGTSIICNYMKPVGFQNLADFRHIHLNQVTQDSAFFCWGVSGITISLIASLIRTVVPINDFILSIIFYTAFMSELLFYIWAFWPACCPASKAKIPGALKTCIKCFKKSGKEVKIMCGNQVVYAQNSSAAICPQHNFPCLTEEAHSLSKTTARYLETILNLVPGTINYDKVTAPHNCACINEEADTIKFQLDGSKSPKQVKYLCEAKDYEVAAYELTHKKCVHQCKPQEGLGDQLSSTSSCGVVTNLPHGQPQDKIPQSLYQECLAVTSSRPLMAIKEHVTNWQTPLSKGAKDIVMPINFAVDFREQELAEARAILQEHGHDLKVHTRKIDKYIHSTDTVKALRVVTPELVHEYGHGPQHTAYTTTFWQEGHSAAFTSFVDESQNSEHPFHLIPRLHSATLLRHRHFIQILAAIFCAITLLFILYSSFAGGQCIHAGINPLTSEAYGYSCLTAQPYLNPEGTCDGKVLNDPGLLDYIKAHRSLKGVCFERTRRTTVRNSRCGFSYDIISLKFREIAVPCENEGHTHYELHPVHFKFFDLVLMFLRPAQTYETPYMTKHTDSYELCTVIGHSVYCTSIFTQFGPTGFCITAFSFIVFFIFMLYLYMSLQRHFREYTTSLIGICITFSISFFLAYVSYPLLIVFLVIMNCVAFSITYVFFIFTLIMLGLATNFLLLTVGFIFILAYMLYGYINKINGAVTIQNGKITFDGTLAEISMHLIPMTHEVAMDIMEHTGVFLDGICQRMNAPGSEGRLCKKIFEAICEGKSYRSTYQPTHNKVHALMHSLVKGVRTAGFVDRTLLGSVVECYGVDRQTVNYGIATYIKHQGRMCFVTARHVVRDYEKAMVKIDGQRPYLHFKQDKIMFSGGNAYLMVDDTQRTAITAAGLKAAPLSGESFSSVANKPLSCIILRNGYLTATSACTLESGHLLSVESAQGDSGAPIFSDKGLIFILQGSNSNTVVTDVNGNSPDLSFDDVSSSASRPKYSWSQFYYTHKHLLSRADSEADRDSWTRMRADFIDAGDFENSATAERQLCQAFIDQRILVNASLYLKPIEIDVARQYEDVSAICEEAYGKPKMKLHSNTKWTQHSVIKEHKFATSGLPGLHLKITAHAICYFISIIYIALQKRSPVYLGYGLLVKVLAKFILESKLCKKIFWTRQFLNVITFIPLISIFLKADMELIKTVGAAAKQVAVDQQVGQIFQQQEDLHMLGIIIIVIYQLLINILHCVHNPFRYITEGLITLTLSLGYFYLIGVTYGKAVITAVIITFTCLTSELPALVFILYMSAFHNCIGVCIIIIAFLATNIVPPVIRPYLSYFYRHRLYVLSHLYHRFKYQHKRDPGYWELICLSFFSEVQPSSIMLYEPQSFIIKADKPWQPIEHEEIDAEVLGVFRTIAINTTDPKEACELAGITYDKHKNQPQYAALFTRVQAEINHIYRVNYILNKLGLNNNHDNTKTVGFMVLCSVFADKRCQVPESIKNAIFDTHRLQEPHHPEYFQKKRRGFNHCDLLECFIDRTDRAWQFSGGKQCHVGEEFYPQYPTGVCPLEGSSKAHSQQCSCQETLTAAFKELTKNEQALLSFYQEQQVTESKTRQPTLELDIYMNMRIAAIEYNTNAINLLIMGLGLEGCSTNKERNLVMSTCQNMSNPGPALPLIFKGLRQITAEHGCTLQALAQGETMSALFEDYKRKYESAEPGSQDKAMYRRKMNITENELRALDSLDRKLQKHLVRFSCEEQLKDNLSQRYQRLRDTYMMLINKFQASQQLRFRELVHGVSTLASQHIPHIGTINKPTETCIFKSTSNGVTYELTIKEGEDTLFELVVENIRDSKQLECDPSSASADQYPLTFDIVDTKQLPRYNELKHAPDDNYDNEDDETPRVTLHNNAIFRDAELKLDDSKGALTVSTVNGTILAREVTTATDDTVNIAGHHIAFTPDIHYYTTQVIKAVTQHFTNYRNHTITIYGIPSGAHKAKQAIPTACQGFVTIPGYVFCDTCNNDGTTRHDHRCQLAGFYYQIPLEGAHNAKEYFKTHTICPHNRYICNAEHCETVRPAHQEN